MAYTSSDVSVGDDGTAAQYNNLRADLLKILTAGGKINWDGWVDISDSWTYASANTITVPSGAASLYQKGDQIKFTINGTVRFYYVIDVADTTLTLIEETNTALTDHAISDIYMSRLGRPFGFPEHFTYTPTIGGFTVSTSSSIKAFYTIEGVKLTLWIRMTSGLASDENIFTITTPVAAHVLSGMAWHGEVSYAGDAGAIVLNNVAVSIPSGSDTMTLYKRTTGVEGNTSWTASGTKHASFKLEYII